MSFSVIPLRLSSRRRIRSATVEPFISIRVEGSGGTFPILEPMSFPRFPLPFPVVFECVVRVDDLRGVWAVPHGCG